LAFNLLNIKEANFSFQIGSLIKANRLKGRDAKPLA